MKFDKNFFEIQAFSPADLERFRASAIRDIGIARTGEHPEVKFHFTYMALVKAGIFCLAREGYRVKSKPGHHQKILEALAKILDDENVLLVGDKMRRDRNADLYDSTGRYNDKEVGEYFDFIDGIVKGFIK